MQIYGIPILAYLYTFLFFNLGNLRQREEDVDNELLA